MWVAFVLGNTLQVTWYCVSVMSLVFHYLFWAGCVHLRIFLLEFHAVNLSRPSQSHVTCFQLHHCCLLETWKHISHKSWYSAWYSSYFVFSAVGPLIGYFLRIFLLEMACLNEEEILECPYSLPENENDSEDCDEDCAPAWWKLGSNASKPCSLNDGLLIITSYTILHHSPLWGSLLKHTST